jgi:predicted transcriptional regulator
MTIWREPTALAAQAGKRVINMSGLTETFRKEIDLFLKTSGMKPSVFGRAVLNDPAFVTTIRNGKSPRAETIDRVRNWISDYVGEQTAA